VTAPAPPSESESDREREGHKVPSARVRDQIEAGAFEDRRPEEVLAWAIETFHPRLALSASFGAPEGMVVLDMMHRLEPGSRVFLLDTGRLPQAVYDLVDRVRDRYDKRVEVVFPRAADVQAMVGEKGMNLFYESLEHRKLCCRVRKVEPMRRFVADNLDAYVTGLRRDQGATRAETAVVQIDDSMGGAVKVNPIAAWTQEQVWQYVRRHNVPVNRLHAEGYPSVGCAPCSRAVRAGEDPRAGRWWWERSETKECGLHTDVQEGGSGI
jgi:thioredoxin-dependent adenylylsulfate APS reductase